MNSRWTTNPIKRDGQTVSIRPNLAGDIEILKCFRYPALTAIDIAALTRRTYGAIIARLNLLKRKPHCLIKVHDTQLQNPRIYQWSPQVYELTDAGADKLREIGFEPPNRSNKHFLHTITENQIASSFEIATRDRFIPFKEILESPYTPKHVRETGDHVIPVSFSHRGKEYDRVIPDALPFGISYPDENYRFCLIECDLATEQLRWSNSDRQTIERKFLAYLTVLDQKIYQTHFGFQSLNILFTTTTSVRMQSMIELLASMNTEYLPHFGFQQFSTIIGDTPQPTDRGWAFNQPWLQCGGKTLNLGEV